MQKIICLIIICEYETWPILMLTPISLDSFTFFLNSFEVEKCIDMYFVYMKYTIHHSNFLVSYYV